MSEFTTTPEERAAATYLEWDDAALGRFTKHIALTFASLREDAEGFHKVTVTAAAIHLACAAAECNAGKMTLNFGGVTVKDEEFGDWVITVERSGRMTSKPNYLLRVMTGVWLSIIAVVIGWLLRGVAI